MVCYLRVFGMYCVFLLMQEFDLPNMVVCIML